VYHRAEKINLNEAPRSDLFCTFAASIVERFDLIATTRKNAKPMLFPWVPEPVEGPFQSTLPTQIHY
jgi:hypothetical protein